MARRSASLSFGSSLMISDALTAGMYLTGRGLSGCNSHFLTHPLSHLPRFSTPSSFSTKATISRRSDVKTRRLPDLGFQSGIQASAENSGQSARET